MAHAMMRHLVQRGHRVDVLLSAVDPAVTRDYKHEGVHVIQRRGKTDPADMLQSNPRPDVVLAHLENVPRASLLARMFETPLVHVQHNNMAPTTNQLERFRPDLVVFNTEWMRAFYEEYFAELAQPIPRNIIVPPPTDPAEYATTPGDMVTLINLFRPKGAELFYELARRRPDLKFLAVTGGYGDQLIRHDLANVEIMPHISSDRMRDEVYARTRVLLMPSSYESYGRVAAEAMCSGIPVIAHPTPGLLECVDDGGLFADHERPNEWLAHLEHLDHLDRYREASAAAKARASRFDPDADLDRFADTLEEVARVRARHV